MINEKQKPTNRKYLDNYDRIFNVAEPVAGRNDGIREGGDNDNDSNPPSDDECCGQADDAGAWDDDAGGWDAGFPEHERVTL